jgi:hypothetical protein
MFTMVLPLYLTRNDLKQKLGWHCSPTHTTRLQDARRNADPFPPAYRAVFCVGTDEIPGRNRGPCHHALETLAARVLRAALTALTTTLLTTTLLAGFLLILALLATLLAAALLATALLARFRLAALLLARLLLVALTTLAALVLLAALILIRHFCCSFDWDYSRTDNHLDSNSFLFRVVKLVRIVLYL